ncbi:hypothetical protein P5673_023077 [Acropora cervicornis]|uniref:Uncharacterized protein n=1 Tax=Acropora cervicornis TaxID=6130 RepID=A0AAD9UZB1_ACRCE|nr:hypothetical protein P5673_023077 [Acropora cervicornis]
MRKPEFRVSENDPAENTAATCVELQCKLIRQEIETTSQNPPCIDQGHATVTHKMCLYYHCSSCVLFSETLPARLRAFGLPRMTNHTKRKGDYRSFYTILNRRGLWHDPIYIARKEALGCYVEDVREVMPICVVENDVFLAHQVASLQSPSELVLNLGYSNF